MKTKKSNDVELRGTPFVYDTYESGVVIVSDSLQSQNDFKFKLNVEDNVRAVLELQLDTDGKPLKRDEIESRLTALLGELRVEHLRKSPSLALSGGERRRVEIARALATRPRFILLDEPFAGIDPIAVIEIQRIINFLKARGIGVLITDHNVRETLGICDHAYIISDGTVLAEGTPTEIVNNADVRRVYLGEHFKM